MTDTPLPEPVAWTWLDHIGCDHIDMDEQHALVTAAACGTVPTPLYTERQAREAAEAEARSNQLHAEREHNEGRRLSERLKEADADVQRLKYENDLLAEGVGLLREKILEAEAVNLAVQSVLAAEDNFRSNMMADWEGDPLSDAIDALRAAAAAWIAKGETDGNQ